MTGLKRGAGHLINAQIVHLGTRRNISGLATYRDLAVWSNDNSESEHGRAV